MSGCSYLGDTRFAVSCVDDGLAGNPPRMFICGRFACVCGVGGCSWVDVSIVGDIWADVSGWMIHGGVALGG